MATASATYGGTSRPPDTGPRVLPGGGPRSSFKEKLLQWRSGVTPYRADDGFQLADDDISVEMRSDRPSLWFSDRFRSHIACPWVFSIITKVLGRRFSYRFICSKVASLWKPQGGFQVIDLGNDYFLVRFERREDCARVLAEGPWMIQGSYMIVQSWQPCFDASKDPTRTVVWVQIPELLVEWYRQDILSAVAKQIGKPIRIDINTLHAERAKFARLAIEVEFTKPLLGRVEIEGRWFKVSYEDILDFCFHCGFVGHMASQCTNVRSMLQAAEQDRSVQPPVVPNSAPQQPQVAGIGQEGCSKFGAWMKVSKPS
ncbi:hypothetical protein Tsubulata_000162 [Turnera subulata]|uniref:CCHC-type domain-containing protein n=1 Tax=Turnera subulata TaxID=218843 RepID=A0A9Q0GDH4_9ROSI|nr:hypothetical protein Tsubulata_000162 [Turnera subulata]